MKILVSACLLGRDCKYNGGNNRNECLLEFLKDHEVIPVCPEVLGGLPIPRDPAEIVGDTVRTGSGRSVDREYRIGAERALKIGMEAGAQLAILQSRSPSCGVKEIYDGSFTRRKIPGKGIFARVLEANGIPMVDIEDLKHFLEEQA